MSDNLDQKRPLFIVAGMPRGATTFLYHYLAQHPDIFLPFRKEVNYFGTNFDRGEDWYHSLYVDMKDELVAGDISPPYFLDENSIDRIRAYGENVKIILIIRSPAEWAVSLYHQFKSYNYDVPPIEEYLTHGYTTKFGDKPLSVNFSGSWITNRIKQFQEAFGENILIYDFAFFKKNPLETLKQIEDFLNVSNYFTETNFDNRRINESKRRNIRFVSWLLSREKFISFIALLLPGKTIRAVRSIFDKFSAKTAGESSKLNAHDEQEILLAMNYLGLEVEKVNAMFSRSPILIGSRPIERVNRND